MKTIFENNGGSYTQQGNYLLPNLTLSDGIEKQIGVGNKTQTIFEIKPSGALLQSSYIKQARQLPCRC